MMGELVPRWRARLRQRLAIAARHLPPTLTFTALELLARAVPLERLPTARTAATALGLEGQAHADFCRRAWVGTKASDILWERIQHEPASSLVSHVDFTSLDAARATGRGVLLTAAHMGPQRVLVTLLRERYPETLFLLHEPSIVVGAAHARTIDTDAAAALVEANRHLRKGGLVYLAPDGISGALSLTLPLSGGSVRMSRGAATLARLSGAIAVPVLAAFVDRRIHAFSSAPLDISGFADARAAADRWERAWLDAYIAQIERWTRDLPPENLRLYGSIYERWEPSPTPH